MEFQQELDQDDIGQYMTEVESDEGYQLEEEEKE